ncbi:hypothetical protein [Motilibacter aurantiacus]|uniref:hypothetical protein n=1 Tax=Motilibacter aurantiacus TaxID=2714955 RepID=UPI00140C33CD|nr:hypothetical protein [Motilibacter aurantiacus]NHC45304.1 hypothetical protein [Motilibacter aurantiacus]
MTGLRSTVHLRVRTRGEDGSALVEFCWLAVLLLVPLTWVLLAVFRTQATAYAVTAAAREAGRAYVTTSGSSATPAQSRATAAASLTLASFGVALDRRDLDIDGALRPGTPVTVELTASVPLPFVPEWLGGSSVRVHARHVELVDQYR